MPEWMAAMATSIVWALPGQCDKSGERRRTFLLDGGSGFSIGHMSPMLARIRKNDLLLMRNA